MSEPTKTCVLCGLDCSGTAHVRDRQGRYACAECVDAERRRAAKAPGRAAAAAAREPSPAHAAVRASPSEAGSYTLAEEDPATRGHPAPAAVAALGREVCPICVTPLSPRKGRCPHCGYDRNAAAEAASGKRRKKDQIFCTECGYDMAGLPGNRCPECGTVCDLSPRRRYDREVSRRVALWSYLKPAIMLAAGLVGILIILLLQDQPHMIGFYIAKWGILVPIGVFAFFLCCLMWVGFDAPFHRVALELAAIYAIVDLIGLAMYGLIPNDIVNGLVVYFIYIGLLVSMLDLDYVDAIAVALVTLLLRFAVFIILWKIFGLP